MPGGIAEELYPGMMLSSVEADTRGSIPNPILPADGNLDESDPGDLWYGEDDDEDSVNKSSTMTSDMDREWHKRRNQFHTIGYRDGLIAGKEAAAQEGFNVGFKDSVFIGYNWGRVRGITSALACLPGGLREKMVDTEEARNKFRGLHESVQSLSKTDALKLFYEEQKGKSSKRNESGKPSSSTTDLNRQSRNVGVLESYHQQLQSLMSESPLLKCKEMNPQKSFTSHPSNEGLVLPY